MLKIQLIKFSAVLLLGIMIGATVNGWQLTAQMMALKAEHSQQITDIVQVAARAATDALERQRKAIAELSQIDLKYAQELQHGKAEADGLRDAVAAGERRLRIQAACPATDRASVPGTSATTSVDDDAGARLTDAAVQDYFRLRDRITAITAQVNGLQEYIRSACQ